MKKKGMNFIVLGLALETLCFFFQLPLSFLAGGFFVLGLERRRS